MGKNQRDKLRKTSGAYTSGAFFDELKQAFEDRGFTGLDFVMIEAKKTDIRSGISSEDKQQALKLYLNVAGIKAQALQTDEGIVVLKGSESCSETQPSFSDTHKKIREKFISDGTIAKVGDKYIFQRDVIFETPSPAAAIVVGSSISGPQYWKNSDGKSLKKIEQERMGK